jgi:plasmid stabilization system protein ParE
VSSSLEIRLSRQAAAQIEAAAAWWLKNRPAAPGAIRTDLEEILSLLAEHPGIGTPATKSRIKGLRRIYLSRIRYYVYYRERGDILEVLAFWHASRGQTPRIHTQ